MPVFEKYARLPDIVLAATARPTPPWPLEPTGWRAAAGYSTGLPSSYSFPAAATSRTLRLAAYWIALVSSGELPSPPMLRLTIFAPWSTA